MSLEELYNEVKDLDDCEPAAMDKIYIYWKDLKDECDKFMEILVDKLGMATVTWDQPWYQKHQTLTRPMIKGNSDGCETFRTDKVNSREDKRIRKNWRKLRKTYDVPDKMIYLAKWRNRKTRNHKLPEEDVRRYVIAYLAQGLERTLKQVHSYIVSAYGGSVRGRYSPQEQKIMNICCYHDPEKAIPILSTLLNREPRGIYRVLKCGYGPNVNSKYPIKRWDLPLATKFLKLLMKHTDSSLEELKYKHIDPSVWVELQSPMSMNYYRLRRYWYNSLHVQLFTKTVTTLKSLRKKLFKKLIASEYRLWTDIRWEALVKEFPDGFTNTFLYTVALGVVKTYPNYINAKVKDIAAYGLQCQTRKQLCLKPVRLNENGVLETWTLKKSKL